MASAFIYLRVTLQFRLLPPRSKFTRLADWLHAFDVLPLKATLSALRTFAATCLNFYLADKAGARVPWDWELNHRCSIAKLLGFSPFLAVNARSISGAIPNAQELVSSYEDQKCTACWQRTLAFAALQSVMGFAYLERG